MHNILGAYDARTALRIVARYWIPPQHEHEHEQQRAKKRAMISSHSPGEPSRGS
ncbi:hypothetical protein BKA56DRAFT_583403 [Ilyonectria sp. MPI-CAGE-AT-0026]|nr:hypothetical protein BKA56DRAFT_583403 [Ilyonectria sp. MPI-CAGE-AT-0026]